MDRKSWEGIVSFLCEFWWLLLTIIAIIVVLVLTRNLWMPILRL